MGYNKAYAAFNYNTRKQFSVTYISVSVALNMCIKTRARNCTTKTSDYNVQYSIHICNTDRVVLKLNNYILYIANEWCDNLLNEANCLESEI